ncbi:MAG: hypothetical protein M0002_07210 [Rhodospirillales bacterium]|nr:hypothetical protein [Rhodospirillales bacterium]
MTHPSARSGMAARAVAAGALTLALTRLLGRVAPIALGEQMLGFVLSLFLTAFVRSATPARQNATILLAVLSGFAASTLTTVLAPVRWLAGGLVGVLTLAAYFAARGPRALALLLRLDSGLGRAHRLL